MSRILVVEDDPGNRLILKSRLADQGYEVETVETGALGLVEARSTNFDLFLVSTSLGTGIDGLEVCRRLKGMPGTHPVPVVLFTQQNAGKEEVERGYAAGAEAYVTRAEMPSLDHVVAVKVRAKAVYDELTRCRRMLEEQNKRLTEATRARPGEGEASGREGNEHALLLRELATGHADGLLVVDTEGIVRWADRGACEYLGNRVEGRNLGSLAPSTGLEAFARDARTEAREGFRFDLPARKGRTAHSLIASVIPLVCHPGEEDHGLRVVLLLDSRKRRVAADALRTDDPAILRQELGALREAARDVYQPEALLGEHPALVDLRAAVGDLVRRNDRSPVLLVGEEGTGKARVARTLHYASQRTGPYFEFVCGAFAPDNVEVELFGQVRAADDASRGDRAGLCQHAQDGTLYLVDVDALPVELQERLIALARSGEVLRAGAPRPEPVDVNLVASTRLDADELRHACDEGRLSPALLDLFAPSTLHLPPLRDRGQDAALLARHFFELRGGRLGEGEAADELLAVFARHPWERNVDELAAAVEETCEAAAGDVVGPEHLPRALRDPEEDLPRHHIYPVRRGEGGTVKGTHAVGSEGAARGLGPRGKRAWDISDEDPVSLELYEKKALLRALDEVGGDKLAAARLLKVGKSTLYRKLKRYEIQ